ncbi:Protein SABRE, partial [Dimargaris xerosporica]
MGLLAYVTTLVGIVGVICLVVYYFLTRFVQAALAKHNIRFEKIRFLSLCNLSINLPKSDQTNGNGAIVHLTVARVGLRFHRWRRPLGLTYVKPIEFYLRDVTVKVFRPPPSRAAATAARSAKPTASPAPRASDHGRSRPSHPSRSATAEPSILGLFNVSKNNFLVRFARGVAENVSLIITDAEVIIDDQVQVALGMAMLYSSVFDLGNPDEQRRQQQMHRLPLSMLSSYAETDPTNTLRYITILSISDLDCALVPSKAKKRRSIVGKFRGNGTWTLSTDIAFDPFIRLQNMQWDTQLETFDLFLRPAIHAFYKLRRTSWQRTRTTAPASGVPEHIDLSQWLQFPAAWLRRLEDPRWRWVPSQVDVSANLRQLNVYFNFPMESKGVSSSSETPARDRPAYSGTMRFSLKSLTLLLQVPDLGAQETKIIADLRFKMAVLTLLKSPATSDSPPSRQDRRLLGVQSVHVHVDGDVTSVETLPDRTEPLVRTLSSTIPFSGSSSFTHPPGTSDLSGERLPSTSQRRPSKTSPDYPHRIDSFRRYTSHIKGKVTVTRPFIDIQLDDLELWEGFVKHVRQTRYAATKTNTTPIFSPQTVSALYSHRATRSGYPNAPEPNVIPSQALDESPSLSPPALPTAVQTKAKPMTIDDAHEYIIPTMAMEVTITNPSAKLWVPGAYDADDGIKDPVLAPVDENPRWPLGSGAVKSLDNTLGASPRPVASENQLLLVIDTAEVQLLVRGYRKNPGLSKLAGQAPSVFSPPSATTATAPASPAVVCSVFCRASVEPVRLLVNAQSPLPPKLLAVDATAAHLVRPLLAVDGATMEWRTVLDVSPWLHQIVVTDQLLMKQALDHDPFNHTMAGFPNPVYSIEPPPIAPMLLVLNAEASARVGAVTLTLPQASQQRLTRLLPMLKASIERVRALAHSTAKKYPFASPDHRPSPSPGPIPSTAASFPHASSPFNARSAATCAYRPHATEPPTVIASSAAWTRRVRVHQAKASASLPLVRLEVSISDQALGLPYRGRNEKNSVHDVILECHTLHSTFSLTNQPLSVALASLHLPRASSPNRFTSTHDASSTINSPNLWPPPELPEETNPVTVLTDPLSAPSSVSTTASVATRQHLSMPSESISPPHLPVTNTVGDGVTANHDPDSSACITTWFLDGHCQSLRGYILTVPVASASPPPSPRCLSRPPNPALLPYAPRQHLERILYVEHGRFSAKKALTSAWETESLPISPTADPSPTLPLPGASEQSANDVVITVATNVDCDMLHMEYSVSRAYVMILLWARRRQIYHMVISDWLQLCAMADWSPLPAADASTHSPTGLGINYGYYYHPRDNSLSSRSSGSHPRSASPSVSALQPSGGHSQDRYDDTVSTTHGSVPYNAHCLKSLHPPLALTKVTSASDGLPRFYTLTVSCSIVNAVVWLPLGCNDFNEVDMAARLHHDIALNCFHRVRLLGHQAMLVHTRSVMDAPQRAALSASPEGLASSSATDSATLSATRESMPTKDCRRDWLFTCHLIQVLGKSNYVADEQVTLAKMVQAGADKLFLDAKVSDHTAAESPPLVGDGSQPETQAWLGITRDNLKHLIDEVALVTLDAFTLKPTTPQLLISPAAPGQPTTTSSGPTQSTSVPLTQWNLQALATAARQSPAALAQALQAGFQGTVEPSSSSHPLEPTSASRSYTKSPIPPTSPTMASTDAPSYPETVDTKDPLVIAAKAFEVEAESLQTRLPYRYNIAFLIDNVNNMVKATRNLIHFAEHELESTLNRGAFNQATSNIQCNSTSHAVLVGTQALAAEQPTPWEPTSLSVPTSPTYRESLSRKFVKGSQVGLMGMPAKGLSGRSARRRVHTALPSHPSAPVEANEKSWHLAWPKPVQQPKRVPYLTLRLGRLECTVDDDPFETALGKIYRYGLEEQKARLARAAAFEKTAQRLQPTTQLEASDDGDSNAGEATMANSGKQPLSSSSSQSSGQSGADVDIAAAYNRLQRYNATNWVRVIRNTMCHPSDVDSLPGSSGKPSDRSPMRPAGSPTFLSPFHYAFHQTISESSGARPTTESNTYSHQHVGHNPDAGSSSDNRHNQRADASSRDRPARIRTTVRKYTPSSWLHPRIPLTHLIIRDFDLTVAPPPRIRTMQDAAWFVRHTDGCTPLSYQYDIMVPIRLHLRMGDTKATLRNYPLPLLHIPDITRLVENMQMASTSPAQGPVFADRGTRFRRHQLVSILNKRTPPSTHGRLQKEKYLKAKLSNPDLMRSQSDASHGLRLDLAHTSLTNASDEGSMLASGDASRSRFEARSGGGCAWEIKGDLIAAEPLSSEESVRVIWVPVIVEGITLGTTLGAHGSSALLMNTAYLAPQEPNIGFVRVHRTVPPPKFFTRLNIRIHTAPHASVMPTSPTSPSAGFWSTQRTRASKPAAGLSHTPQSPQIFRPPVQITWDQSIQPCITTFSQRLENLTSASVDPSPPIAWWDKMRFLMHGSVRLKFVEAPDLEMAAMPLSPGSTSSPMHETPRRSQGMPGHHGSLDPPQLAPGARKPSTHWRRRSKAPGPMQSPTSPSGRTSSPPGELWLLMRGTRDPYAMGTDNGGFLTIWRGDIQVSIGQIHDRSMPVVRAVDQQSSPMINFSPVLGQDKARKDQISADRLPPGTHSPSGPATSEAEPRRARSLSTLITNHDMIVRDVVQIKSREFLFTIPVLCDSTPCDTTGSQRQGSRDRHSGKEPTSTAAQPRVRFNFLPSYKLTKHYQQGQASKDAGTAAQVGHTRHPSDYLLGYTDVGQNSPLLRFEKVLLHLRDGVDFTVGLGFGVNLDTLRCLDRYAQWLFSPTPWLSTQLRTQGGILLPDHADELSPPVGFDASARMSSSLGLPRPSTRPSRPRRTEPVKHYEIIMRTPQFARAPFGEGSYDSYYGFRSDHVHMSMGLRCSYHQVQPEAQHLSHTSAHNPNVATCAAIERPQTVLINDVSQDSGNTPPLSSTNGCPKNFIGLSTNTIHRVMQFTPLFASKMLLPIRRGDLFPDVSRKDLKFGKQLKSVKCRLDVADLDLSYCQHYEQADPDLAAFEAAIKNHAFKLDESLLVNGQAMEIKAKVRAMDLNLLAIQQSKKLTVDSVKGTIHHEDRARTRSSALGRSASRDRSLSSEPRSAHRTYRSPSEDSLTSRVSTNADAHQKQVISRQWMIDDCELELEHIDIRIVQADFHLFTQALAMNAGLPLAYHGAMRLLPAHLEQLPPNDQRFVSMETLQDIDEPQLSEAVFSNVQVEPLIYSPRIVYFKQAHQADDDPNYHSIPLYQNVDERHHSFQSNAANLQDSRAIQISLLQSRLQRVRQELAVQRELQQEMEDYLLNADPAQEVVAMQTLERARMNYVDLEHKQRTIERSVRKLKATQPASPIARETAQLKCDQHRCELRPPLTDPASYADAGSLGKATGYPTNDGDDDDDNEGSEDSYAATFKHRFLVHSAYGIWNTHVRNVLLKLMYVEESARALRYFMSMSAHKVVRELLIATDEEAKASPGTRSVTDYFSSAERLHIDPTDEALTEMEMRSEGSSALPPDAKSPTATAVGPAASDQPVSATSPSRFLQLIKPRKPRRHDIVLNQATTEEYIQYLLASERNVEHEPTHPLGSTAPMREGIDPDDSPSKPAHFRRARHVLTKLRDYYSHHDRLARTMPGQAKDPTPDALLGPEEDWGLLNDLADYFIVNSTYVEFLNPQVNASLYHDSDDAVILAAERIQLKTLSLFDDITVEKDVTNPQDDNENLVKTRSLFGFENFQLFAVQKKNFATKPLYFADCNYGANSRQLWPMWVPMEVLLDEPDQTLSILEPLVQKTSGILIYDKANTVRIQANSADINLDDRANFLGLHFPELVITADSRQYSVIFSIINDLL